MKHGRRRAPSPAEVEAEVADTIVQSAALRSELQSLRQELSATQVEVESFARLLAEFHDEP